MKQQFLAMLLARGMSSVLQAANLVLLARSASLEDFGLLAVLTSVSVLILTFFDLGMSTLIPKSRALNLHEQVSAGLRLNAISTYLLAAISTTSFYIGYLFNQVPLWTVILVCALALEKKIETALSVFIADGNKSIPNFSILLRRLIPFLGTATAVWLHNDTILVYSAAYLVVVFLSVLNVDRLLRGRLKVRRSGRHSLRRIATESWPYFIGNLSAHARYIDTSLVAAVTSITGAAIYSAASKVVNPLQLVPQTLTAILMPHSARLNAVEARSLVNRLTLAFLSMLLLLVPTTFFAAPIVTILFGPDFLAAAPVLGVSLLALPFVTLSSPLGSVLQGQGLEKFVALNGVITAAVMLIAIPSFAIMWGVVGAAAAVGFSFTLKCGLLFFRSRSLA